MTKGEDGNKVPKVMYDTNGAQCQEHLKRKKTNLSNAIRNSGNY